MRISIHAFRVEGDTANPGGVGHGWVFQSTPSVWKATFLNAGQLYGPKISIHAFRVEGDEQPLNSDGLTV